MKFIEQSVELLNEQDYGTVVRLLEQAGRTCYQSNRSETLGGAEKFLQNLIRAGHESVVEHLNITVKFVTSRNITHQIVRHRLSSYCLSGDTEVYTDILSNGGVRRRTLKELYEMTEQYRNMTHIRSANLETGELVNNKIVDVCYSGKQPVYEIETELGYKIKSTMQHRFWTGSNWVRLAGLSEGDNLYTNGEPAHRNKDWLYQKYHVENLTQEEMGELCGVSNHTIRKWVAIHNLQKENGEWQAGKEPPNKGRTKYDYPPLMETSKKMKGKFYGKRLYGSENPAYRGDDIGISGGYFRTYKNKKRKNICEICGFGGFTEIHHKDKNPKNYNKENLIELCIPCHKEEHNQGSILLIRKDKIKSIKYIGVEDTYDIEMKAPHHNFVANGFIVHNSQMSTRYVNQTKDGGLEVIKPALPIGSEEWNEFKNSVEESEYTYNKLKAKGVKNDLAREVLPGCIATELVMTSNVRSWRHFFKVRCDSASHYQIQELAKLALIKMYNAYPCLFEDLYKEFITW